MSIPYEQDDRYKQIARVCSSLNPVELVMPINGLEEREKFRRDPSYNPAFKYDVGKLTEAANQYERLRDFKDRLFRERPHLARREEDNNMAFFVLVPRVFEAILTTEIANTILCGDDKKTAEKVTQKYGKLQSDPYALKNFRFPFYLPTMKEETALELKQMRFGPQEIAKVFQRVLDIYEFEDWKISLEPECTAIDVQDKNASGVQKIVIPANKKPISGLKLMELVGHEIECHVRASENSRRFWRNVLKEEYSCLIPILAKSDDEVAYEGKAKFSDWHVSGDAGLPDPKRAIALKMASEGKTFSAIACEVARLKNPKCPDPDKDGWVTARRVLRGSVDPSNSAGYAFWKDRAYLDGLVTLCCDSAVTTRIHHFSSMSLRDPIIETRLLSSSIVRDLHIRINPEHYHLILT